MKSTLQKQTKQLAAFLRCRKSIRHGSSNDSGLRHSQSDVQNKKAFRNKQYTPKSKDQPYGSDRTHFYVRFNNSNVAMHRPTIIFLLPHKITTVQQNNQNKITSNNQKKQSPQPLNQKHSQNKPSKQSTTNKPDKLSHQSIVKSITRTTTTSNPHNLSIKTLSNKPSKQTQQTIMTISKDF